MRLSGYQPQYFPRLHYFARILNSDIFHISDSLQFVADHIYVTNEGQHCRMKSYQAHTKIKTTNGEFLLRVPVKKHQGLKPINETVIDDIQPWKHKHLATISTAYSRAPNFKSMYPELKKVILRPNKSLADLNISTIFWALSYIIDFNHQGNITLQKINSILKKEHPFRLKKIVLGSMLHTDPTYIKLSPTDKIIENCRMFSADEYYCGGIASTAYLDSYKLNVAGIIPVVQNWQCKEYLQQHIKAGFIKNLSIIDLLINVNHITAKHILLNS